MKIPGIDENNNFLQNLDPLGLNRILFSNCLSYFNKELINGRTIL